MIRWFRFNHHGATLYAHAFTQITDNVACYVDPVSRYSRNMIHVGYHVRIGIHEQRIELRCLQCACVRMCVRASVWEGQFR